MRRASGGCAPQSAPSVQQDSRAEYDLASPFVRTAARPGWPRSLRVTTSAQPIAAADLRHSFYVAVWPHVA